jgi:hypothetical protein
VTVKLHNVHVRVNDAATGQPTPVRIRITDGAGRYYPPLGNLTPFPTGPNEAVGGNVLLAGKEYAYISGTCEVPLPPGRLSVEFHKGPEYTPQALELTLGAGQLSLRCAIQRWTDLRSERWYSGDMRAHYLTPHAALLEAAAEDLATVQLLACEGSILCAAEVPGSQQPAYRSVISNLHAFSGQRPALELPGHLVVVNTHNTHRLLGNLGLINSHRVVHPLFVDDAELGGEYTLADWCDQCHRKNGLVIWTDPLQLPMSSGSSYGEALADLVLGKIDALELSNNWPLEKFVESYWYPLLHCGLRVPLVGSSGKKSNAEQLGAWRTYARLLPGETFSYSSWIEAVRAGRTFVTNGPLICVSVNGQDPGSVINLPSLDQSVEIVAETRSMLPFDFMDVLLNGEILQRVAATGSPARASLHLQSSLPAPGWLAVRASGPQLDPGTGGGKRVAAHTSPVYVHVNGSSPKANPTHCARLMGELDKMIGWVANQRNAENRGLPGRLTAILQSARQALTERAETA